MAREDAERFHPDTVEQWARWLAEHHDRGEGVWLVLWRRDSGRPVLPYEEVIREALCWGWIDGQAKTLDDQRSLLWFTRRKPSSAWSAPNKRRVAELQAEGRMQPQGLALVEHAKATGTWILLEDADALIEPPALAKRLDATPGARSHWEGLPPSLRRAALSSIALAKRPETKERRIAGIVASSARGERPV